MNNKKRDMLKPDLTDIKLRDTAADEKNNHEKIGFITWIKNHSYYYKSYIIAGATLIIFLIAVYFSMDTITPDLHIYFCVESEVETEALNTLCDNINNYIKDINSDGTVFLKPEYLTLNDKISDKIDKILEDDEIICFITDDAGYKYLYDIDALQTMVFFGIASDEEYRLLLNDTSLWDGVNEEKQFFLVMKNVPIEKYEDYYLSNLTNMVVGIAYDIAGEIELQPDLLLYFYTENEMETEAYNTLRYNINKYVKNVNNDGSVYLKTEYLIIDEDIDSKSGDIINDKNIICFITDEAGYQYLYNKNALQKLEFYGIESSEEYRLLLNDTSLWNDVNETESYYLVMKYMTDEEYADDYIKSLIDIAVTMANGITNESEAE